MKAASAIVRSDDWSKATQEAITQTTAQMAGTRPDLAVLFASHKFAESYAEMLGEIQLATKTPLLVGCSGQGVIGKNREIEGEAALSLMLVSLPGASLKPYHFTQVEIEESSGPGFWHIETEIEPKDVNAWILLADPFNTDVDLLVRQLNEAYPEIPISGGMASGTDEASLFLNTDVFQEGAIGGAGGTGGGSVCPDRAGFQEGAIGVAVGGEWTLQAVVSQGCRPIGEPWTITQVERNIIHQIARKPAYKVLVETFQSLSDEDHNNAHRNLLSGRALK